MIAHPTLLVEPARKAGITLPPDVEDFDSEKFPHWAVFLNAQIGCPMPSPTSHWHNAEVVAAISDDEIMKITGQGLLDAGWQEGFSS